MENFKTAVERIDALLRDINPDAVIHGLHLMAARWCVTCDLPTMLLGTDPHYAALGLFGMRDDDLTLTYDAAYGVACSQRLAEMYAALMAGESPAQVMARITPYTGPVVSS